MKNELTQNEILDFLRQHIFAGFMTLIDRDISSIIFTADGIVQIATNKWAKLLGFKSWKEVQGFSLDHLYLHDIKLLPASNLESKENHAYAVEVFNALADCRARALKSAIPVTEILIHPFTHQYRNSLLIKHIPIFHSNGSIIAVQTYMNYLDLFSINDYLSGYEQRELNVPNIIANSDNLPIKLTARQHEILFLLLTGISQNHIAKLLKITRSTVAAVIRESIAPKFKIEDSDSVKLILKARSLGYHLYIPPSLCKPWVITLNEA